MTTERWRDQPAYYLGNSSVYGKPLVWTLKLQTSGIGGEWIELLRFETSHDHSDVPWKRLLAVAIAHRTGSMPAPEILEAAFARLHGHLRIEGDELDHALDRGVQGVML